MLKSKKPPIVRAFITFVLPQTNVNNMEEYEILKTVNSIYCPYCNERTKVNRSSNKLTHINFEVRDNTPRECLRFNDLINQKVVLLVQGKLTDSQFLDWSSQFQQKPL